MSRPVAIIGAGLAGLACALHLHRHGVAVRLFEASNDVGGRIRTDEQDGFLLDRGFQVLNVAYPEAQRMLDYDALELQYFERSFTFPTEDGLYTLAQPRLSLTDLRSVFRFPLGTFGDKLRGLKLLWALRRASPKRLLRKPERSTRDHLDQLGFTPEFVEALFRPFFSGVFLERELETSSRWFELLFNQFANGAAALPKAGMQAMPRQLAAQLPPEMVHLGTRVNEVSSRSIILDSGETVLCGAAVLATSESTAAQLMNEEQSAHRVGRSVHCLYFDAPQDAVVLDRPTIVLGRPQGVITTFCVPSLVAPSYAPAGRHLVSVSVVPRPDLDPLTLEAQCRAELTEQLGDAVESWRLIDHQIVDDALPPQRCGEFLTERSAMHSPGIFRCGDYLESSSIHGALVSGRKTAEWIRRSLD